MAMHATTLFVCLGAHLPYLLLLGFLRKFIHDKMIFDGTDTSVIIKSWLSGYGDFGCPRFYLPP
jgi:hypothetical protein